MTSAVRRILQFLKGRVRWSRARRISPAISSLFERLLDNEEIDSSKIEGNDLPAFERWILLEKVLSKVDRKAVHFLHIPKTGGTTFTGAMSRDPRFLVVSVDSQCDVFLRQLSAIINDTKNRRIFIRAHHGLSLAQQSGVINKVEFSFVIIRNPAEIQSSNANMIIRRIQATLSGRPQAEEEREYALRWLAVMGGANAQGVAFARELLATPEYRAEMGRVYTKMFDISDWRTMLGEGKLLCLNMMELDKVFAAGFGYPKAPPRLNVSDSRPICSDQIPGEILRPLVAQDGEIYDVLKGSCTPPSEIVARLQRLVAD